MENKYKLLINLSSEMQKVYEKSYKEEKYDLLVNEDGIIIAKKNNDNSINLEHEELIIRTVSSMAKKYTQVGFLYIDLTKVINSILKKLRDDGKIRIADKRITWPIRQEITKAIVDKSKKASFD